MIGEGLPSIFGAARLEPAGARQDGPKHELVSAYRGYRQPGAKAHDLIKAARACSISRTISLASTTSVDGRATKTRSSVPGRVPSLR